MPKRIIPSEPAAPSGPPADPGAFVVERDVMVPMRDGVCLATDIYFPARGAQKLSGKFPAILERTPYNKEGNFHGMPPAPWQPYFARHGYVCVAQDTRGRFKSEGTWHMMTDDVADGFDTAAWLVRQTWSDGGFAMIGTSYTGGTQHAMALSDPPGLKALVPVDAVAEAGYFGMRYGGAYELRFMNWVFAMAAPEGSRAARDPATREILEETGRNIRHYLCNLPIRTGMTPLRFAPEYEDWLVRAMGHGANDEYWQQPGFGVSANIASYKDVPVCLIGGWYDSWGRPTTMVFDALSKAKRGPLKLIMGPWIHGRHMMPVHGEVNFGSEAAIHGLRFRKRWYDRWLKGAENGVENEPPVRIFVMGGGPETLGSDGRHFHGGYWRDEHEWPLARTRFTPFYLHAGGTLSADRPGVPAASTSYDFDPRDPVPTIGGNVSSGAEIMLQGAWDQRGGEHVWNSVNDLPLSARRDVLVFMTSPLDAPLEVTGPIDVHLWISSSAPDTDFTAKLIDVHPASSDYPGGFDMNLADGIIRARFRNSLAVEELMRPGEICRVTIQLYPTSNLFMPGHRLESEHGRAVESASADGDCNQYNSSRSRTP
ncbi:MAG: CocE/NonD family hydrolase [Candidatus Binataceae bacterium]